MRWQLALVCLRRSSADPKELQNHVKALVKAWAKRAAKNKVAKAKAKVTGSSKKLAEDTASAATVTV